jgi:DNA polymerase-3 subunit epsilon
VEGTLSLFDWHPMPGPGGAAPEAAARGPAILVIDCETTGIDFARDQVIELCVQHGLDDNARKQVWRFLPAVPIAPAAQAVHGISLADLAGCPSFAEVADELARLFASVDVIVGYNVAFDIDMLQAEYARLGRTPLDFTGKRIVDAFRLWQKFEPRSLQHAHERFVGDAFTAAHSASADVAATGRVLVGMLRQFNLDGADWEQIAAVCDPDQRAARASWVGPSRHLRWDGDTIVVNFGRYAGVPLHELAAGPDRGFVYWVIAPSGPTGPTGPSGTSGPSGRTFPPHVVDVCRAALELPREALHAWARQRFGQAAPTASPPFTR